jgi:crossover junction endodeoxyribonuclease RuvC
MIYRKMDVIIRQHKPQAVAIEAPFFGKNVQSMLKLGRAQGVAIAAAMMHGLNAAEYAPRKIKQSITGNGNATKEQVWTMLQRTLQFDEDPAYMDATDAVAVALTHHYTLCLPYAPDPKQPTRISGAKKRSDWASYIKAHPEKLD